LVYNIIITIAKVCSVTSTVTTCTDIGAQAVRLQVQTSASFTAILCGI